MSENTNTNTNISAPQAKKELLKITLRRDLSTGRIYIRLQGNPDTFAPLRNVSSSANSTFNFLSDSSLQTHFCRRDSLAGLRFNTSSYSNFDTTTYINGSMLLSPALAGGVEYPVTDGPVDDDAVVDFRNRFKDAVKMLYKSFLRPLNLSVSIHAVEVESLD